MLLHPFVSFRVSMFHDRVRSIRVKMFVSIRAQGPAAIPVISAHICIYGAGGEGEGKAHGLGFLFARVLFARFLLSAWVIVRPAAGFIPPKQFLMLLVT